MALGDIRDREYRRFAVREETVRALVEMLASVTPERVAAQLG
jgi:hypothetical protein